MQKRKVLEAVKGFRGRARHCNRLAHNRYDKSLLHAYVGRKLKRRDLRSLWLTRINAASRLYSLQYSRFIDGLKQLNVDLNRKMLAELAVNEPYSFRSLVEQVKAMTAVPLQDRLPHLGHIQSELVHNIRQPVWHTERSRQIKATQSYLTDFYNKQRIERMENSSPSSSPSLNTNDTTDIKAIRT